MSSLPYDLPLLQEVLDFLVEKRKEAELRDTTNSSLTTDLLQDFIDRLVYEDDAPLPEKEEESDDEEEPTTCDECGGDLEGVWVEHMLAGNLCMKCDEGEDEDE